MTALDDLRKEIAGLREEIVDLRRDMRRFMRDRTPTEVPTDKPPLDYDFLGDRKTQGTTDNSVDFNTFHEEDPA